ncbi:hypothetical protein L6V77_17800 [Myxococcota bacterium]|jgi:hypothetical protein|nr:hypothetical protein [Myxococcota bacterium]
MATPISQTQNRPVPQPARGPQQSQVRTEAGRGPETRRADRPETEAQRPRPSAEQADRVQLQSRDPRETGRTVQAQGQAVSQFQSAGQKVDAGRRDLERLGQLAERSANGPESEDRAALNEEAQSIGNRLAETDRDPAVEGARNALRQASLERNADQARTEADRLGRRADAASQVEERRPPTLVLEARRPDSAQARQRADAAETDARAAERAAERQAEADAEEAGENEQSSTRLRPESVDVSTADRARDTGRAVTEAQGRADRFRSDLQRAENEAGREANETTRQAAESTGNRRLTTEAESRQTADRVRRQAAEDPRRFVDAQARVNADAAARLLA